MEDPDDNLKIYGKANVQYRISIEICQRDNSLGKKKRNIEYVIRLCF